MQDSPSYIVRAASAVQIPIAFKLNMTDENPAGWYTLTLSTAPRCADMLPYASSEMARMMKYSACLVTHSMLQVARHSMTTTSLTHVQHCCMRCERSKADAADVLHPISYHHRYGE